MNKLRDLVPLFRTCFFFFARIHLFKIIYIQIWYLTFGQEKKICGFLTMIQSKVRIIIIVPEGLILITWINPNLLSRNEIFQLTFCGVLKNTRRIIRNSVTWRLSVKLKLDGKRRMKRVRVGNGLTREIGRGQQMVEQDLIGQNKFGLYDRRVGRITGILQSEISK